MPVLEFVHTEYTGHTLLRADAISFAAETHVRFSNIDNTELLARFSLLGSEPSYDPKFVHTDLHRLYKDKFISEKTDPLLDYVTLKGVVALNMIGVEVYDDELEVYLREPFKEITVLDELRTLGLARK